MTPWYILALWGLLGAFIYAAPRFSACYFASRQSEGSSVQCGVDLVLSLAVGTAAAVVVSPWIQNYFHRQGDHEVRAIAAMVGLLANPVAPRLVNIETLVSVLKSIKGPVP